MDQEILLGNVKMEAMEYVKGKIGIENTSIYNKNVNLVHLITFLDAYTIYRKFSGRLPHLIDIGRIISYVANGSAHLPLVKNYYKRRLSDGYVIGGNVSDIDVGFSDTGENFNNINSIW
jgi:hypothetical protein